MIEFFKCTHKYTVLNWVLIHCIYVNVSLVHSLFFITNLDTFKTSHKLNYILIRSMFKKKEYNWRYFFWFSWFKLNFTVFLTEFPTDRLIYESYYTTTIDWFNKRKKKTKKKKEKRLKNKTRKTSYNTPVLKI